MKNIHIKISIILLLLISVNLRAQVNLPETSGLRGFVRPSFGYLNFRSNTVASFLRYDLANPIIQSIYSQPETQGMPLFLLPFEVTYTFSKTKTQLLLGTQLDDLIRFNLTMQLGVRQQFNKVGIFQFSFLLNSLPTMVWSDPYVANVDRVQTERHSYGLRFMWDKILNSDFRIQYSVRRIKIGNEDSGSQLWLTPEQQAQLNRKGFTHTVELVYWIKLKKRQLIAPALVYIYDDREGTARARNAFEARINYSWFGKQFAVTTNAFIGFTKHKEESPVYLKTQQDIYYNLVAAVYYKNPWGWKIGNSEPMNFFMSMAAYQANTNIDFYYRDALMISGGILFRWAKRN